MAGVHHMNVSSFTEPNSAIFDATEDVQISLGIQRSLGTVWTRGLQWMGSLSLAWQDEYSVENTEFDAHLPTEQTLKVRSQSNAWSVNSTTRTVRSDEHVRQSKVVSHNVVSDGGEHQKTRRKKDERNKKRREHRIDKDGLSVDRKADGKRRDRRIDKNESSVDRKRDGKRRDRRVDKDGMNVDRKKDGKKRRDRHKRDDAEAVDSEPDGNKRSGRLTKHRLSKRPSRLLVPASTLHIVIDNPNEPPQLTRHQHISTSHMLSDSTTVSAQHPRSPPTHRRTKSMPIPQTSLDNLHPKLPVLRQTASTITTVTPLTEEQCIVQLEDQVSDMFVELGLRSPYKDSKRLPNDTEPTPCLCDTPLWFLSTEYESSKKCEDEKYIILMDDDSSFSE
ncbi:hypothetical protein LPJ77_005263 [Coemansia sp. RSA 2523]|nr:hypothetical protein LPJ77_005263 [Coemansia sp. RSA 2523]